MRRILALLLCLVAVPAQGLLAGPARAAWPDRPITLIVPFSPGGGADIAGRSMGRWLEARLGQPVVVVNRPGAGGAIGFAATAQAAPDGHTIGVVTLPNLVTIPIERRAGYTVDQLALIANLVDDVGGVFVRADSRFRSMADLVAAARRDPGAVSFGTTGVGTYAHLGMLALERQAGISLTAVAYGSTAPMRAALLQGELQVGGLSMTDATQEMAAGTLRPLGQMAAERWPGTPEVPTLREQGFDVVLSSLRGFAAPAGTPPAILRRLSDLVGEAARDPGFRALAEKQAMPLGYQDSAAFAAGIAGMRAQYERLWREQPWRERD
ncbi:tripartite tricarboxylate transporter substrate binding protein [Dankookia rubra]|uniref:Tripartite tricarboxylate transporter substrate binding protein n=1 Tax=Dankookia rubra TaxID=1442381 RepID=A0A4R5Q7D3_9PROT|nr:tripartite tricarboxylate transporter substrate binding protein [Dankookia rubra]TDH58606.1 tripartite tricarboxylate transporter substrate binding protein [Dankookia rubra]